MNSIGSVLEDALRDMKYYKRLKEHLVLEVWDEVVGEHIAKQAQPNSIKDNCLFVIVSTLAWMHQLESLEQMIIKNLNRKVGEGGVVKKVIFRLGQIPSTKGLKGTVSDKKWSDTEVDKNCMESIKKDLTHIRDPEIRDIFSRTMIKDAKLRSSRKI